MVTRNLDRSHWESHFAGPGQILQSHPTEIMIRPDEQVLATTGIGLAFDGSKLELGLRHEADVITINLVDSIRVTTTRDGIEFIEILSSDLCQLTWRFEVPDLVTDTVDQAGDKSFLASAPPS